jgi:hypothetical protein
MRKLILVLCMLAVMAIAAAAAANDGRASGVCVNGQHIVTVSGWYDEQFAEPVVGIKVLRQAIGVCEPEAYLPDDPLPIETAPDPEGGGLPIYEVTLTVDPPTPGAAYRYTPFGVREDGSLVTMYNYCGADMRSYALIACDGAPLLRGTVGITYAGSDILVTIDPCSGDCWTESLGLPLTADAFESLAGEPWTALLGQAVDVSGDRTYCTMPGGDYYALTAIVRAPDGVCGPIPVERRSWGGVKALYR